MKISEKCNLLREMFPDYKSSKKYSDTTDRLMDITMSCTDEEALDQLIGIMNHTDTKFDIIELLSAYDLYESIRANMSSKYDI